MFQKGWQPKEYKGVQDEIKQQHMKTKGMSFKDRLSYFWYYYKIHTIAAVIIIIAASVFIHDIATTKDYSFYGIMLNFSFMDGDALEASFGEYANLDMENYECFVDTLSTFSFQSQTQYDLATYQKIIALMQSGDLDCIVPDAQVFESFAVNSMFIDLRELFSEEELSRYEGSIYYVDYAKIREAEEAQDNGSVTEEAQDDGSVTEEAQDRSNASLDDIYAKAQIHKHPEDMAEPVPVGIFLEDSFLVEKTGYNKQLAPVFGVVVTSQRTDTAKKYLEFLFDETIAFEDMFTYY